MHNLQNIEEINAEVYFVPNVDSVILQLCVFRDCRATDWMPIVNSLRINKTLEFVAFRSHYQTTLEEHGQWLL